jgi:fumarylacetoacetase
MPDERAEGPDPYGGFGPENLPYGVDDQGRAVVAYGGKVIDLAALAAHDRHWDRSFLAGGDGVAVDPDIFASGSLNAFMSLGPQAWDAARMWLKGRLVDLPADVLRPRDEARLVLPFEVADYVDFYSCEAHVVAMGRLLRPGEDPLPPAWRHLPIGYHGRSATVVVSGEAVPRPAGIVAGEGSPQHGPTRRLDVEVELGFVIGVGNPRGEPVAAGRAGEHVFGVVLVNDWSARDIQAFEYRPLGPFLGKSFATSVSPWLVPLEAIRPWQVAGPPQAPDPAPYLSVPEPRGLDVNLELSLNGTVISTTTAAGLYWSMAQQLAHVTVNGAATRTGELFATGTISGTAPASAGSLMELTSGGREPLVLDDGSTRAWLEDGDEVVIRGWCGARGKPGWVSLGEVRGRVVPPGGRMVTDDVADSTGAGATGGEVVRL